MERMNGALKLILKFLLLVAGAAFFFILFPFAIRYGLPAYVGFLALLAGTGAAFRLMCGKKSFRVTLSLWLGGSVIYLLVALPLILRGVQPLTYLSLNPLNLVLYYLSYPLRLLGVFFIGLIFMRVISPVEFLRWGRAGLQIALAFRAFEYSVNALEETRLALLIQGEWPDFAGGRLSLSLAGKAVKASPILVATTFRNIILWFPWAWICYNALVKKISERGEK